MAENVDAVVIGMGPGGEEVAGSLAQAGLRVVGIEQALVGGECPYWGCVPTKMMIRAADVLAEGRRIPGVAGSSSVSPDWMPVARRIRDEATDSWNDRVAVEAQSLPGTMIVLGGGSVGLEVGQAFARFGVRVTVVEAQHRLLPLEEPEAGKTIAESWSARGLRSASGRAPPACPTMGTGSELPWTAVTRWRLSACWSPWAARRTSAGWGRERRPRPVRALDPDRSLHARSCRHLGRGRCDRRGRLHLRRHVPGGDRDGGHTGQGVGSRRLSGPAPRDLHRPRGGLGRAHRGQGDGHLCENRRRPGRPLRPGWIHGPGNDGFIKLVEDRTHGILVGATSVGPRGGEVLSMLALAVKAEMPISTLREMLYAYPTFHRGVEDALRDLATG